jgi:hypothetical protein
VFGKIYRRLQVKITCVIFTILYFFCSNDSYLFHVHALA